MNIIPQEITVNQKTYTLDRRLCFRKSGVKIFEGRSKDDARKVVVKTCTGNAQIERAGVSRTVDAYDIFSSIRSQLLAAGIPDFIAYDRYRDTRVTEYIPGKDMYDHAKDLGGLNIREVKDFFLAGIPHLEIFRQAGVQHGDIKPDNFIGPTRLRKNYDNKKLNTHTMRPIDMELMHRIGCTGTGWVFGTNYYVAPEVMTSKYTTTSDIFSLGMSGMFLLGGKENHIQMWKYIFTGTYGRDTYLSRANGTFLLPNARKRLTDKLLRQFPEDHKTVMQVMEFAFRCLEEDASARPQTLIEQQQILGDTGNLSEI